MSPTLDLSAAADPLRRRLIRTATSYQDNSTSVLSGSRILTKGVSIAEDSCQSSRGPQPTVQPIKMAAMVIVKLSFFHLPGRPKSRSRLHPSQRHSRPALCLPQLPVPPRNERICSLGRPPDAPLPSGQPREPAPGRGRIRWAVVHSRGDTCPVAGGDGPRGVHGLL